MSVLLTGGTGYIGSHTAVELLENGYEVILLDNLSNSEESVRLDIAKTCGKMPKFCQADACDPAALDKVFSENKIDAVIHFAGYKAVGESCEKPLMYYRNNLDSMLTVLETMKKYGCHVLIFSSSATVYGGDNPVPFVETQRAGGCTNPYGQTKFFIEEILKDAAKADPELSAVILRYFNPIGRHTRGFLAEQPKGVPLNLYPIICQVAEGKLPKLNVTGNDYPTPDGTGVRDYIHIMDLAAGHEAALRYAMAHKGAEIFNLGTGKGTSVLEMIAAFEKVRGVKVPYEFAPRRPGDIAECYADCSKAKELLGWEAKYTVEDACK